MMFSEGKKGGPQDSIIIPFTHSYTFRKQNWARIFGDAYLNGKTIKKKKKGK